MASSDLTLQSLLAGQVDPMTAAYQQRMQYAQGLMQQGSDTSPTNKYGGLARVLQGVLGGYLTNNATQGFQDAYKGSAGAAAATLPPSSALSRALTSQDPMVRAQGWAAYRQGLLAQSEPKFANPGQQPTTGTDITAPPIGGGFTAPAHAQVDLKNGAYDPATVGTAAGTMAGATDAASASGAAAKEAVVSNARVPAAIATAGGSAGATLPYDIQKQDNQAQNTRETQRIAPYDLRPGETRVMPPITSNAAPPTDKYAGAPNPLLGGLPNPAENAAAPAAKPPAPGSSMPPAVTPDMPPAQPQTVQPQTSNATTVESPYPPSNVMDGRLKVFHDLQSSAQNARDELQRVQLLQNTLHDLGSNGPATPFLANLSRWAEQAGIPPETLARFSLPNGAGESQAHALANNLVMEITKSQFPQRITNADLQFAQTTKPSASMPLGAADYLINNVIRPSAQRDVDRYGAVVNLQNPKHGDFDQSLGSLYPKLYEFDNAHPLTSYTPALKDTAPAPQASAGPAIPEGATASHPDGRKMVRLNGKWVDQPAAKP